VFSAPVSYTEPGQASRLLKNASLRAEGKGLMGEGLHDELV